MSLLCLVEFVPKLVTFGIIEYPYDGGDDKDDDDDDYNNDDDDDDDDDDENRMKKASYVVTRLIDDVTPLRDVIDTLSPLEDASLIEWISTKLAMLHTTSVDDNRQKHCLTFRRRIASLQSSAVLRLVNGAALPSRLVSQVDSFVRKHLNIDQCDDSDWCALHGDVTDENVLLRQQIDTDNNDNNDDDDDDDELHRLMIACSLIDFGDSFECGDPLWELVPLHLSVFRCDKRRMSTFYAIYDRFRNVSIGNNVFLCAYLLKNCRS
jgi:hypothetical protein